MTTRVKLVSWFIAVGLVVGAYVTATHSLTSRFENGLSRLLKQQVKIQSVELIFPTGVVLKKISIPADPSKEGLPPISIREVALRFGLLSFLQGRRDVVMELTAPTISLRRNAKTGVKLLSGRLPLFATRLRIRNGEVTVVDRQVSPEVTWTFQNVSASVSRSHRPEEYLYTILATVADAQKKPVGQCEINGHFFSNGTIEATVSLRQMDLGFLAPYAGAILGTSPSQGTCTLTSQVTLHEGGVLADSQLSASGVVFPTEQPTLVGPTGNRLVEMLRDSAGTIQLSFLVTGRPGEQLNWSELMTSTIRESVRQALAKGIQNVLSSTEQQPVEESVRKGLESIGH